MRHIFATLLCLAAAMMVSVHAFAQHRAAPLDPRAETLELMLKPITVEFEESRLEDVISFLRDVTGADISPLWIDERHFDGLDPEALVSMRVREVPALTLLDRVVKRSRRGVDDATWQLVAETGEIEVGPKSRLNERAELKMYDIRDLLFNVESFSEVPDLGLGQIIQGRGGGGQTDFTPEDRQRGSEDEEAQKIIDLIITFIEPDQWRDSGGDGGSITFHDGHLMVRAPDYIHRQLVGYPFWPARDRR